MLPHAFVIARLSPVRSASKTSPYGSQAAANLETREFVALRIHLVQETGFYESSQKLAHKGLFMVSVHKPRAPFEHFYLPLTTGDEKEALTLNHPLPNDVSILYIHTFPLIYEEDYDFMDMDESANSSIEPSFYQLDNESYRRFLAFYQDFRPPKMSTRLSGGPEVVDAGWETFSGRHRYEIKAPERLSFSFDISPLKGLPFHSTADVWMELLALQRLREEYSWYGVTCTVNWLCDIRHWSGPIKPFNACARQYEGSIPLLDTDSYSEVYAFPVPVDVDRVSLQSGEAHDDDEADNDWDWFPPGPEFAAVPEFTTVVPEANRLRVVLIDICGAVFDLVSSSRNALRQLGIPEAYVDHWFVRLREIQALEDDAQSSTFIDASRRALLTVAKSLPEVSHSQIEMAVQTLIHPSLLPGIRESLGALNTSSLAVFGFSLLDATASKAILGQLTSALPLHILSSFDEAPGLFSPCTEDHMQLLLERVRDRGILDLEPGQIVVVSPSSVRVLEPATVAGMATALLALPEHPEVNALDRHYTVESTMVLQPHNLATTICTPGNWKRSTPKSKAPWGDLRVREVYQLLDTPPLLTYGANVEVALAWITNELVAIKYEVPPDDNPALSAVRYEAYVYRHLADCIAIPRMHWSGSDGGAEVLVLDLLGPTLEELRLACRGMLSLKSVLMIGLQMLDFIEFAHSRGIILRDIKPQNSAIGRAPELAGTIFNFDFGNAKAYVDSRTGAHIPLRSGRKITGTKRFCSHWSHQGLECSRRDDIVVFGHMLLHLLWGKLPWQGIYAPTPEAKLQRMGEMKDLRHPALAMLLAQSPTALSGLMTYAHGLDFAQKPDYMVLRGLLEREMYERRWLNDSLFDWLRPELASPLGTLIPWEYRFAYDPSGVPPFLSPHFRSSGEVYEDWLLR